MVLFTDTDTDETHPDTGVVTSDANGMVEVNNQTKIFIIIKYK